mmetsp:Transcript_4572/g.13241  ORF Transcript_4572/g.13241 Transcript_4572/m.13241 type:complete len:88 (+) Transcript_4572:954-1217(+)
MSNTARSLLVPVDESKASRYVFKWVLDNILRDGDKVHLLHVVKPGRYVLLSSGLMVDEFVEDETVSNENLVSAKNQHTNPQFCAALW